MEIPNGIKIILVVIAIGIIGWITFSAARTIDPGERGVLVTFGSVDMSQVYGQGLHFINPFGGQSLVAVNTQTQVAAQKAGAASKDLQDVSTQIAVNYHLDPEQVNKLYNDVGLGYNAKLIQPFSQEAIKRITAQYNAAELIGQREVVKQKILDILKENLVKYGIIVEQVSITDFNFSPEFNKEVEAKVTASQVKQKEEINLQIKEVQARQAVAVAEGQKNASIAIAEGNKQSSILHAEGVAQSADIINTALEKSPLYLQYKKIDTWNGQLPKVLGSDSNQIIALPADLLANATK